MSYITDPTNVPKLGEPVILRDEMLRTDVPVDPLYPSDPARLKIDDEVIVVGVHTRRYKGTPITAVLVVAIEVERADGATATLSSFEDFRRLTPVQKRARTRERNARNEDGPRW